MSKEIPEDPSKRKPEDWKYLADRGLLSAEEEDEHLTGNVSRPEPEAQGEPEPSDRISGEYASYEKKDLVKEAEARGYEVDKGATKTELVKVLQEDDREQAEGSRGRTL